MPIVNGIYVNDQMPQITSKTRQERRDWSDATTAEYNFLLKQQENAYNLELWNLANQYNSPAAQMQRYQDAGLNPNLVYSQQNATSPLSAAQNQAFRSQGTHAKQVQNQLATISEIQSLVKSAAETYDYIQYGRDTSRWRMIGSQESVIGQKLNNAWNDYLLHGENMIYGDSQRMVQGPKATLYKYQQDLALQNYERVKYMVSSMLPTQKARQEALTELDKYQLEFMQGKYEAVLDIDLGLGDKVNQWARMLMFIALAQVM